MYGHRPMYDCTYIKCGHHIFVGHSSSKVAKIKMNQTPLQRIVTYYKYDGLSATKHKIKHKVNFQKSNFDMVCHDAG